jgi:hypothetical protein
MSWALDARGVVLISHRCAGGKRCAGACPNHQLVSLDPLHLEPSLILPCGVHGWIRGGAWVDT